MGKRFMDEAKLDQQMALFIGDTDHDYEVASALGTSCILVESGYQARSRLDACGCPVLDSLSGVLPILDYSKEKRKEH